MTKKRRNHAGMFKAGDPRTAEAASKGGSRTAKARRAAAGLDPYEGTVLDVMDSAGLTGPTWAAWRTFLRAVFALPMDEGELAIYRRHTERAAPPSAPVAEAVMPIGRRGGKSRIAAVCALYLGIRFDASRLAPGERATIPVLAADRRQSRQIMNYLKGMCGLEEFRPYTFRELKEGIELTTGVDLAVATASYRTVRGYTSPAVIADEVAFWSTDDGSANPDTEILAALRPAMVTIPDALLLMLSSPYAARGELYRAVSRSFGRDDDARVLVWNADSRSMNPDIPQGVVDQAFEDDPVAAASEYGRDGRVAFRRDVEAAFDPEAVQAVTAQGRRELPRTGGLQYVAFVDPSGGSKDSFTLAVAHAEGEVAVLDAVRERRPPFSPDEVVEEYAELLRSYGVSTVTGDRYAGQFPRELFRKHGIQYLTSDRTKSDIYRELVAPVNAARVELLDLPTLRAQLVGLDRRSGRGGRDSIDHAPGGKDDVANAAGGALVQVVSTNLPDRCYPEFNRLAHVPDDPIRLRSGWWLYLAADAAVWGLWQTDGEYGAELVAEWHASGAHLTSGRTALGVLEWLTEHDVSFDRIKAVIADPAGDVRDEQSGQSRNELLRAEWARMRQNVPAWYPANAAEDGIETVRVLLQGSLHGEPFDLRISPRCSLTIDALSSCRWREDREGRRTTHGQPGADMVRYFCHSMYPASGGRNYEPEAYTPATKGRI